MKKIILTIVAGLISVFGTMAQNDWLHIYSNGKINTGLAKEVTDVNFTPTSESDTLFDKMSVVRGNDSYSFNMAQIDSIVFGTNVPTIYIDIENGAEVVVKDTYLKAKIRIEGYGSFEDFPETDVTIKGRGNSTWNMAKKPYRLKFSKKQQLLSFAKAKNFALIANFIDCTMMRNPIALKLGHMLGMEFTNSFIPVNLIINGKYRGSYMITEKIGINSGSVDIDETNSILFELDTNYDEPYKFHSNVFRLPVMVKDPDFDELAAEAGATETAAQMFNRWKDEFHKLENTLSTYGTPSSSFTNEMDIESLVNYIMVYAITGNHEPYHPKSVYLYKTQGEKFKFGPLWDFDWAYTFSENYEGRGKYNESLLGSGYSGSVGSQFFRAMLRSPEVMNLYKERWEKFKTEIYPELKKFIDEYAKLIEVTASQNGEIWPSGYYNNYSLRGTEKFSENVETLKTWLDNRINWLDNAPNLGLY